MNSPERIVRLPGGRAGVKAFRPDIEAPNVTVLGVRVADPLRQIKLTDSEWAAAERLRADHDLATGYREDAGESVRVDRSYTGPAGYLDAQLDALRRMAEVHSVVLPRPQWDVLQYVVLQWLSLAAAAAELRIDPETVGRRLRAGLAGLSEYYG